MLNNIVELSLWSKFQQHLNKNTTISIRSICGNTVLSQNLTDPILADVVSRQFRAPYWLIATKLIHMSCRGTLTSLVITSLFTYEQHVIETFLQNSALMLYVPRVPPWRHVSSGWHISWLQPKLYSWVGLSLHKVLAFSIAGTLCFTHMWKSCSDPNRYETHVDWLTPVQGGILADYDQIDTHGLK